jgi:hypothetical protein
MCLIRGSFIECVTQAHKSISPVGDKVLSGAIKNLQQIVQHVSKNKLTCFITTEKNCQMFEIVYRHFTLIIQGGPDITCQKNSGSLEGSNKSKKPPFVRSKIMGIN